MKTRLHALGMALITSAALSLVGCKDQMGNELDRLPDADEQMNARHADQLPDYQVDIDVETVDDRIAAILLGIETPQDRALEDAEIHAKLFTEDGRGAPLDITFTPTDNMGEYQAEVDLSTEDKWHIRARISTIAGGYFIYDHTVPSREGLLDEWLGEDRAQEDRDRGAEDDADRAAPDQMTDDEAMPHHMNNDEAIPPAAGREANPLP